MLSVLLVEAGIGMITETSVAGYILKVYPTRETELWNTWTHADYTDVLVALPGQKGDVWAASLLSFSGLSSLFLA